MTSVHISKPWQMVVADILEVPVFSNNILPDRNTVLHTYGGYLQLVLMLDQTDLLQDLFPTLVSMSYAICISDKSMK